MLAVMLGEMGRRGNWHWPDIIEIQRAVLSYRRSVHDVSGDLDSAGHELLLSVDRHGLAGLPTSASTANVSAVDATDTVLRDTTITIDDGVITAVSPAAPNEATQPEAVVRPQTIRWFKRRPGAA